MPIPVLKQGKVLIAFLQAAATDADLAQLRDELALRVGRDRANGVVIDLTVLDVVDSFAARTLRGIAQATKLRGVTTFVIGLQPDVAFAMVQMGLTLDGIATALNLDDALVMLAAAADHGD
jgi:rsbT antagonist protein RsbS